MRSKNNRYQTSCCLTGKYGKISQASGGRSKKSGHLTVVAEKRRFPAFQVQKGQKMGLRDGSSFQAGCRGFESRLPLHPNLVAMKMKSFMAERAGS
jgi:hypothetical protein